MIIVLLTTLLAIAGAVGGIAASSTPSINRLVPFSAGLLVGMGLLLLIPEALTRSSFQEVFALAALGWIAFWGIEGLLHSVRPDVHKDGTMSLLPVLLALAVHNALDGWNISVALRVSGVGVQTSILTSMAIHKLAGGLAEGAILRSSTLSRRRAIVTAVIVEVMTLVGAAIETLLQSPLGETWTPRLLAVTAGTFLYLGFHAWSGVGRQTTPRAKFVSGALGLSAVWVISIFAH
jgi:zinc and cadmium transporter